MLIEAPVNINPLQNYSQELPREVIAVTPQSAVEDFTRLHPNLVPLLKEFESAGEFAHAARTLACAESIILKMMDNGTIDQHTAMSLFEMDGGILLHDIGKPGIEEGGDMAGSKKNFEYEKYLATDEELERKAASPQLDIRPKEVVDKAHLHPLVGRVIINQMAEAGLISIEEARIWSPIAGEHHELRFSTLEDPQKASYPNDKASLPESSINAWARILIEAADTVSSMSEYRQGRPPLSLEIIAGQLNTMITDTSVADTFRNGDEFYHPVSSSRIEERKYRVFKAALETAGDLGTLLKEDFKFFPDTTVLEVAEMSEADQSEHFPIYKDLLAKSWEDYGKEFEETFIKNGSREFFHKNRQAEK